MYKLHIFDVDGTIVDSMRMWDKVGVLYLKSVGITAPDDIAEILDPMMLPEAIAYIAKTFDVEGGESAVRAGIEAFLADQYWNRLIAFPEMPDILREMQARGERMIVFSNTPHEFLDVMLRRIGLYDIFDRIYSVGDIGIRKDYPEAFTIVCELMDVSPGEVLVHEDSTYAIRAAEAAGCAVKVYDRYR